MTSTPTTRKRLRKQSLGSGVNLWGDPNLNEVLDAIDQSMDGYESIVLSADVTLTTTNYTTVDQAKYRVLNFTGTGSWAVTFPNVEGWYLILNNATGTTTCKCSGGTGVAIPTGFIGLIYGDGIDMRNGAPTFHGGAGSFAGALTLAGQLHGLTAGSAGTDGVNVTQLSAAIAAAVIPGTAGTLLNTINDTTRGPLQDKLKLSGGALLPIINAGGNEYSVVPPFGLIQGSAQTANFAASSNTRYPLTKSGAVTVTLPAAPAVNDVVQVEINGLTGLVTYALNSLKYYGSTTNPVSAQEGVQTFIYTGASRGWIDS